MAIEVAHANKCLQKKSLVWGFEIFDLFILVTLFTILNFVFGGTQYKIFFTWIPTLIAAGALRFGKAGKPDNYIQHLVRFYFMPKVLSAFSGPKSKRVFIVKEVRNVKR